MYDVEQLNITGKVLDLREGWKQINKKDVDMLITADHGNCEEMGPESQPKTSHTTNLVPFWYIHNGEPQDNIKKEGGLSDMAPTMLALFGIDVPEEMTGHCLVK